MTGATKRVLVLQGGGALGAYQAGVFEALAEEGLEPQWLAGISVGAINAALIAGNAPERRVEALRAFWRHASDGPQVDLGPLLSPLRTIQSQVNAAGTVLFGAPASSEPRLPPPHRCSRKARRRRSVSTIPRRSRTRSSGWSISTASTPARRASASDR